MSEEVKRDPRRPRTTRRSRKHQATIPVAVLAEAGVEAGERLRVEALGPGGVVGTRADARLGGAPGGVGGGGSGWGRWGRGGPCSPGPTTVSRPGPVRWAGTSTRRATSRSFAPNGT